MPRRLALVTAAGLWFLVAWFWVAWPALGYLQLSDALGEVTSWDVWRPLLLGPLDGDSTLQDASGYQNVLVYGNWFFGWMLLFLALFSTGRLFEDEESNDFHIWSYVFLLAVVIVFLVLGRS